MSEVAIQVELLLTPCLGRIHRQLPQPNSKESCQLQVSSDLCEYLQDEFIYFYNKKEKIFRSVISGPTFIDLHAYVAEGDNELSNYHR